MSEQLRLSLSIRRCPPSLAESMRQRYLTVMADLAAHYGVSSLSLRIVGRDVELRGPRGGLHACAKVRPAQPMPPVNDPRWYTWCAQAALWVHRARGCRGCGRRLQRVHLDRYGHCPSCRAQDRTNAIRRQMGLGFDTIGAEVENVRVIGRAA